MTTRNKHRIVLDEHDVNRNGVCVRCGTVTDECDPLDGHKVPCGTCGKRTVYSVPFVVFSNIVDVTPEGMNAMHYDLGDMV